MEFNVLRKLFRYGRMRTTVDFAALSSVDLLQVPSVNIGCEISEDFTDVAALISSFSAPLPEMPIVQ